MGELKNIYRILVGKLEGKRPPERPRHIWEDNIRRNLRERRWEGVDWCNWRRIQTSGGLL
jgi:hypothetical protein